MKKLFSFLMIILFFASKATAQEQEEKLNLVYHNLKGKIKSLKSTFYLIDSIGINSPEILFFNENGNLIEVGDYDKNGNFHSRNILKYDDKGNPLERPDLINGGEYIYKYDDKGTLLEKTLRIINTGNILGKKVPDSYRKTTYKYDDTGNLIEKTIHLSNTGKIFGKPMADLYEISTYKYDEIGNRVEETKSSGIGKKIEETEKYKYSFDDKRNCIEIKTYNPKGGRLLKTTTYKYNDDQKLTEESDSEGWILTYKYDFKGNQIEKKWDTQKGKHVNKLVFKYNNNGDLIETSMYNAKESLISNFKYDDPGNLIEKKEYTVNGKLVENTIYTFKYEYDKNLNWIKKTEYWNGLLTKTTQREIVYF